MISGAEQALADGQRSDLVVGDHAAGVADDMRFAVAEPEDPVDVEPGVHARHYGDVLARRQRQRAGEGTRVCLVVLQVFVGHGHRCTVSPLAGVRAEENHPDRIDDGRLFEGHYGDGVALLNRASKSYTVVPPISIGVKFCFTQVAMSAAAPDSRRPGPW